MNFQNTKFMQNRGNDSHRRTATLLVTVLLWTHFLLTPVWSSNVSSITPARTAGVYGAPIPLSHQNSNLSNFETYAQGSKPCYVGTCLDGCNSTADCKVSDFSRKSCTDLMVFSIMTTIHSIGRKSYPRITSDRACTGILHTHGGKSYPVSMYDANEIAAAITISQIAVTISKLITAGIPGLHGGGGGWTALHIIIVHPWSEGYRGNGHKVSGFDTSAYVSSTYATHQSTKFTLSISQGDTKFKAAHPRTTPSHRTPTRFATLSLYDHHFLPTTMDSTSSAMATTMATTTSTPSSLLHRAGMVAADAVAGAMTRMFNRSTTGHGDARLAPADRHETHVDASAPQNCNSAATVVPSFADYRATSSHSESYFESSTSMALPPPTPPRNRRAALPDHAAPSPHDPGDKQAHHDERQQAFDQDMVDFFEQMAATHPSENFDISGNSFMPGVSISNRHHRSEPLPSLLASPDAAAPRPPETMSAVYTPSTSLLDSVRKKLYPDPGDFGCTVGYGGKSALLQIRPAEMSTVDEIAWVDRQRALFKDKTFRKTELDAITAAKSMKDLILGKLNNSDPLGLEQLGLKGSDLTPTMRNQVHITKWVQKVEDSLGEFAGSLFTGISGERFKTRRSHTAGTMLINVCRGDTECQHHLVSVAIQLYALLESRLVEYQSVLDSVNHSIGPEDPLARCAGVIEILFREYVGDQTLYATKAARVVSKLVEYFGCKVVAAGHLKAAIEELQSLVKVLSLLKIEVPDSAIHNAVVEMVSTSLRDNPMHAVFHSAWIKYNGNLFGAPYEEILRVMLENERKMQQTGMLKLTTNNSSSSSGAKSSNNAGRDKKNDRDRQSLSVTARIARSGTVLFTVNGGKEQQAPKTLDEWRSLSNAAKSAIEQQHRAQGWRTGFDGSRQTICAKCKRWSNFCRCHNSHGSDSASKSGNSKSPSPGATSRPKQDGAGNVGNSSSGSRPCFKCGSTLHVIADCPMKKGVTPKQRAALITDEINKQVMAQREADRATGPPAEVAAPKASSTPPPAAPVALQSGAPIALATAAAPSAASPSPTKPPVSAIEMLRRATAGRTILVVSGSANYSVLPTTRSSTRSSRMPTISDDEEAGAKWVDGADSRDTGEVDDDDGWYYYEEGDVEIVPAHGDIDDVGIDPDATYLHYYDREASDSRFAVGGSGQEFNPGGLGTWSVGGIPAPGFDQGARIRAPIMTALAVEMARSGTGEALAAVESLDQRIGSAPDIDDEQVATILYNSLECNMCNMSEYVYVRSVMSYLEYEDLSDKAVEEFIERDTIVVDGGANIGSTSQEGHLEASSIVRAAFTIGTVNGDAQCGAAGYSDITLLTADWDDEPCEHRARLCDMVKCPSTEMILQPTSKYNVLPLEKLMSYDNVDSCLHPPKTGNVRRFFSIDGRDILLLRWEGLFRVVAVRRRNEARYTRHNVLISTKDITSAGALELLSIADTVDTVDGVKEKLERLAVQRAETELRSVVRDAGYLMRDGDDFVIDGGAALVIDHMHGAAGGRIGPPDEIDLDYDLPELEPIQFDEPPEFYVIDDDEGYTLRWRNDPHGHEQSKVFDPDKLLQAFDPDEPPRAKLLEFVDDQAACAALLASLTVDKGALQALADATAANPELTVREYVAILMTHGKRRYTLDEWHRVMNHASEDVLRRTLEAAGISFAGASDRLSYCATCAAAKLRRAPTGSHVHGYRAQYPVRGPASVISHDTAYFVNETISGARRYLVCTDLYSGYSVGSVLVDMPDHRYHVANVLPRLITEVRTMANYTGMTAVYADAAAENMSKELLEALEALHHPVVYASPNTKSITNPNIESRIAYTRACTRAFLIGGGGPPYLAGSAALDSLEKRNDIVGKDGKTPRQRITGVMDPPRYDHWHPYGCLVYIFNDEENDKTLARGIAAVYIGLGKLVNQPGITVYIPSSHQIRSSISYLVDPNTFPFLQGLVEALTNDRCSGARYGFLPDGTELQSLVGRKVKKAFQYGGKDKTEAYWYVGDITRLLPPPKNPERLDDWTFEVAFTDHKTSKRWIEKMVYSDIREHLFETKHILTCDYLDELQLLHEMQWTADVCTAAEAKELAAEAKRVAQETASTGEPKATTGSSRELPESFTSGRISVEAAISYAESIGDKELLREIILARDKEVHNLMSIPALEWVHRLAGDKISKIKFLIKVKATVDTHGFKVKCRGVHCLPKFLMATPDGGWDAVAHTISYPDLLFGVNLALGLGLNFCQLDAIGAYLQAEAPRERMVYQPPSFLTPPRPGMILHAKRALYGHPESGRAWMVLWQSKLEKLGFKRVDRAGTWQIRRDERGIIMICTIVDDSIIMYDRQDTLDDFIRELKTHIDCDVSPLSTFVGITFHHDKENNRMIMHQRPMIEAICKRFGVNKDCEDPVTPLPDRYNVDTKDCPEVVDQARSTLLRQIIGSFSFITNTRPHIKLAVSMLSRVAHNPSPEHLKMGIRILRYLWHTRHVPLVFTAKPWTGPDGFTFPVNLPGAYPDSSLGEGGLDVQRRSRCGFVFMMNGGCFAAKTTIATGVSTSSAMAEIKGLHYCVTEAMALIQTFIQLGMPLSSPIPVFEDNQACINIMTVSNNASSSRHIEIKYFYCQELMERGLVDLRKIATEFELGDGFTKSLPASTYIAHRDYIQGLHHYTASERETMYAIVMG